MKFTELKETDPVSSHFHATIGHALWYIQTVEDMLNHFVTIKKDWKEPGNKTEAEVHEALLAHRKNTLGTTLNVAREEGYFDEKVLNRFYAFKSERDWLIHRSMWQNRDILDDDELQSKILERLESFFQEAWVLINMLDHDTSDFVETFGITREEIDEGTEKILERNRGIGVESCNI